MSAQSTARKVFFDHPAFKQTALIVVAQQNNPTEHVTGPFAFWKKSVGVGTQHTQQLRNSAMAPADHDISAGRKVVYFVNQFRNLTGLKSSVDLQTERLRSRLKGQARAVTTACISGRKQEFQFERLPVDGERFEIFHIGLSSSSSCRRDSVAVRCVFGMANN